MNSKMDETRHFRIPADAPESAAEIIEVVYQALKAKGHDPIMQMVGYIISGDPTYITSYNNARSLIRRLEREIEKQEQLIEEMDQKIEAAAADYQELTRLLEEKEAAETTLMELMEAWEEAQT